jgi:hypothetical protein
MTSTPPAAQVPYFTPNPAHPTHLFVARCACAALALTAVIALCWMIAAGPRDMSGGAYAAFLALHVVVTVLCAFLAAYRPGAAHAEVFTAVALGATALLAATLATLLLRADGAPRALTVFRSAALILTIAAAVLFALIRSRTATHAFLLQASHRGIALALWILIAKLILTAWGRPLTWLRHLMPAAFVLLAVAALTALVVCYTSRDEPDPSTFAEARHLTKTSAILLGGTLVWMLCAALFY